MLDPGTGSGAIAVALATERRGWQITAIDASAGAIDVARHNAELFGLSNIGFLLSDWFAALPAHRRFDLIINQSTYIAMGDRTLTHGDLRFEPQQALGRHRRAGRDPTSLTPRPYLEPGAWLWLEHGADQGGRVAPLRQRGFR